MKRGLRWWECEGGGRKNVAHGASRGNRCVGWQAPERGERTRSAPQVALIVIDSVLPQECEKLLLECNLTMVFLLRRDVVRHRSSSGTAHGERAISSLPSEQPALGKLFVHPA